MEHFKENREEGVSRQEVIQPDPNFKNHSDPIRKNPKAISEGIKHV